MFKTLTLFLVNCAADSKIYRSKYRGNIFLFEDRTSVCFFSVLGISGTKFEEEIIGQSCAIDKCIKQQEENKEGAISLNVCFCCLKK